MGCLTVLKEIFHFRRKKYVVKPDGFEELLRSPADLDLLKMRILRNSKYHKAKVQRGLATDRSLWKILTQWSVFSEASSLPDTLLALTWLAYIFMTISAIPVFSHFIEAASSKDILYATECHWRNGTASNLCAAMPMFTVPTDQVPSLKSPSIIVNGACFGSSAVASSYTSHSRGIGDLILCLLFYGLLFFCIYHENLESKLLCMTYKESYILMHRTGIASFVTSHAYILFSLAYFIILVGIKSRKEADIAVCGNSFTVTYSKEYESRISSAFQLSLLFYVAGKALSSYFSNAYSWVEGDSLLLGERFYSKRLRSAIERNRYREFEVAQDLYYNWLRDTVLAILTKEEFETPLWKVFFRSLIPTRYETDAPLLKDTLEDPNDVLKNPQWEKNYRKKLQEQEELDKVKTSLMSPQHRRRQKRNILFRYFFKPKEDPAKNNTLYETGVICGMVDWGEVPDEDDDPEVNAILNEMMDKDVESVH